MCYTKFINTRKGIKSNNYLLTKFHADSVLSFLKENNINYEKIDIIGFHGQTIYHSPNESWTWQLGDGNYLSTLVNIPVVSCFLFLKIITPSFFEFINLIAFFRVIFSSTKGILSIMNNLH